jgi:hypothetical protein
MPNGWTSHSWPSGAAPESNRASVGLPHLTGFEVQRACPSCACIFVVLATVVGAAVVRASSAPRSTSLTPQLRGLRPASEQYRGTSTLPGAPMDTTQQSARPSCSSSGSRRPDHARRLGRRSASTSRSARRVAAIVHRVSGRDDASNSPFYCQPDPAKEYFVQPKALALLGHGGGEYIIWKKRDGSLSATRVSRVCRP